MFSSSVTTVSYPIVVPASTPGPPGNYLDSQTYALLDERFRDSSVAESTRETSFLTVNTPASSMKKERSEILGNKTPREMMTKSAEAEAEAEVAAGVAAETRRAEVSRRHVDHEKLGSLREQVLSIFS